MDDVAERLAALEQRLVALRATNERLVEEVTALRQGQVSQQETLVRLERELRRGRWLRWIGATIRLLIFLAIVGAILYFFGDWLGQWWIAPWQKLRQLFV